MWWLLQFGEVATQRAYHAFSRRVSLVGKNNKLRWTLVDDRGLSRALSGQFSARGKFAENLRAGGAESAQFLAETVAAAAIPIPLK